MDVSFFAAKPLIGMVHLAALPGSPRFDPTLSALDKALADADALVAGGIDAIMMENFGDAPFFPDQVPPVTIAAMTRIAMAIRERVSVPLGINVLRNDGMAALAIAHAVGAEFIRINVLSGARLTDQGVIQGKAHAIARERQALQASTLVLADVDVKHSAPLAPYDLEQETKDLCDRAGADVVIVSGHGTGGEVDLKELQRVKAAASRPVVIGSGVSHTNIAQLLAIADGAIVGSALKERITAPVDVDKVRNLIAQKKGG